MKKIFLSALLMVALVLGIASIGDCSENAWGRTDTNRLLGKVVPGYLQATGTSFGGATSMTSSTVAVPLNYKMVYKAISSSADAGSTGAVGTLANGTKGEFLKIYITVVGSSGTWVLTPTTKTGFTTLTFNAAGDEATLLYTNDTTGWMLISSTSVTVGAPF